MPFYHVSVAKITKGQHKGGGQGFAQYIAREAADKATQHARYLIRESHPAKEDLVALRAVNLPAWARDGTHFFAMADRYERKDGVVARTYEVALPRELTPDQREALVEDISQAYFRDHPHLWAIHNPLGADNREQPHVHFMVCERRMDGIERSPKGFFRRANRAHPEQGGAAKERRFSERNPGTFHTLRAGIATLTNAAFERAGLDIAVSSESLRARGHTRAPEMSVSRGSYIAHQRGQLAPAWQEVLSQRDLLQREYKPWEAAGDYLAWQAQKTREGIHSVERDAVVAHVRAQFYEPPTREQLRTLHELGQALEHDRAAQATPRARQPHKLPIFGAADESLGGARYRESYERSY